MKHRFSMCGRTPSRGSKVSRIGRRARSVRRESGYALVTLMLFAAILLIGMTVAMPDLKTQAKREKELEAQFRAMQYVRAIQAYNRRFPNQWPTSIDALMNTNNIRFLRKKWDDPLTHDGTWRFIHLGPNGAVIDSKVALTAPNVPSATGTSTAAGASPTGPPSSGISPAGSGGGSITGFSLSSGMSPSASTSSLSQTQLSNLPIVGVASQSTDSALITCNGYDHYSDMEFIALPQGRYGGTGCYLGVPITMLSPSTLGPGGNPFGTGSAPQGLPGSSSTTPPTGASQPSPPGMFTPKN
jgi:type II secretory pathway pseudopilin PulG